MTKKEIQLYEDNGIIIICEHPLEIEAIAEYGMVIGTATGSIAREVLANIKKEHYNEN